VFVLVRFMLSRENMFRKALFVFGIGLLALLVACGEPSAMASLDVGDAIVYKSPTCGCCGLYTQHLERADVSVNIIETDNIDDIKDKYGIPSQLRSCHTTIIGDYFIEGHVPLEAVEKLLTEKPDIKGIGLPGMPSGSPGMPGVKNEEWSIYAINRDGSRSDFMKI